MQHQTSDLQGQLNQLQEQAAQASDAVKTASEERLNELQGQLDTLKTEAEAERARVQEAIDNVGTQFKSEQDAHNTQFEENKKALGRRREAKR